MLDPTCLQSTPHACTDDIRAGAQAPTIAPQRHCTSQVRMQGPQRLKTHERTMPAHEPMYHRSRGTRGPNLAPPPHWPAPCPELGTSLLAPLPDRPAPSRTASERSTASTCARRAWNHQMEYKGCLEGLCTGCLPLHTLAMLQF